MNIAPRPSLRHLTASVALVTFLAPTCQALIKFNDARDEIFVTGVASFGYDSNFNANALSEEDIFVSFGRDLDYLRKAGLIGVNANLGWDMTRFGTNTDQDFVNPHARLELTKDRARTTGSVTMGAERQSRSESVINIRTESWNYDAGLNLKYPVIDRYSLTGKFSYDQTDYEDNATLVDLKSYTAAADLYYVYNSARDLLFGYRYRQTETSSDSSDHDHALTAGITGKILAKLNGTVRVGYQHRTTENRLNSTDHDSITASASTTWSVSRRLNVTGRASRDFFTLASDTSIETTSAGLDAQFGLNSRFALFGGIGCAHSRFLDLALPRRDTSLLANAGISYTKSDRFKAVLTYGYLQNWSTLDFSDYDRHSITLTLSSRW